MRIVFVFCALIGVIIVANHQCEAILRPIIRLRPKIVLGKGELDGGDDDSLNKIYRSIAKTVISGYLFGALRRPFGLPFIGPWGAGGWDGVSPLSVTFAVGGKRPGYHGSSGDSSDYDKSPKVEKIKIIEKEKPVKHIVISHKILSSPASSMSVTGGHLMPGMLEESAMAAIGSEVSSPWSETQTKYATLDSSGSSSAYGLPEALDTTKQVKIVKVKESTDSSDDDEYTTDDEDDTSRNYRVIKRQVYTYKDKSVDEPRSSKYGYKPNYPDGEQAMAESTQAHVIRMENATSEIDYSTEDPIKSTTSTPTSTTSITTTTTTSTATQTPTVNQITTLSSINKTASSTKQTVAHSSTTVSPTPLTTIKTIGSTIKIIKSESLNSSKSNVGSKRSTVKVIKEPTIIVDDPWLDYLNQKEAQESQSTSSKQSTLITGEPIIVVNNKNKKSRKNNRSQITKKTKQSRPQSNSRNQLNSDSMRYNWDEQLANPKINSVKAFGDGWVSRRRNRSKKSKSNRRRSSKLRSKKNKNYRIIRLPTLDSTQGLPINQLIAMPSSSGPIVFPTTIKRSFLESNPFLMPTSLSSNQMFKRRASFTL